MQEYVNKILKNYNAREPFNRPIWWSWNFWNNKFRTIQESDNNRISKTINRCSKINIEKK